MNAYASSHSTTGLFKKYYAFTLRTNKFLEKSLKLPLMKWTDYLHLNPLDVYPTIFPMSLILRLSDNPRGKQREKIRL